MLTDTMMIELLLMVGIAAILISICLLLNTIKIRNKQIQYVVLVLIIILALLVTMLLIINGILWFNDDSLHLGLILGLPALILITAGMILVLYDERRLEWFEI